MSLVSDEALADFFGVAIKNSDAHNPQNWKLGDGLPTGPVRDMADPHFSGFNPKEPPWPHTNVGQPDHYSELVSTNDDIVDIVRGLKMSRVART